MARSVNIITLWHSLDRRKLEQQIFRWQLLFRNIYCRVVHFLIIIEQYTQFNNHILLSDNFSWCVLRTSSSFCPCSFKLLLSNLFISVLRCTCSNVHIYGYHFIILVRRRHCHRLRFLFIAPWIEPIIAAPFLLLFVLFLLLLATILPFILY